MSRSRSFTQWKAGDTNTICDYSGFKCKLSECRETWDGLLVRADFWNPRQPQDLPVTPREQKVYTNIRGEQPDIEYTPPTKEDLSQ